jgi:plasmid stabilization system protein ParE
MYTYIAETLLEPGLGVKLAESLEEAIISLETMPRRGALRKTGAYANSGYRQLFVGNFTVVYRIDELRKRVFIVTIRYSKSHF